MSALLETSEPAAKPNAGSPRQPRILLVDDDPAIRQILTRLLADEEYGVLTAANGAEALTMVASMKFDLVLLDLNMPVKNGWDTFEQMTTENPLLPIVLITARPNQFFPALAAGVGALLEKPLDFVKLLDTISELLREPPELRLAQITGRLARLRYIPPKSVPPEGKSIQKSIRSATGSSTGSTK